MLTKVLSGVSIGLAITAAVGWGAWWVRGRQVEKAQKTAIELRRALSACHTNAAALQRALTRQNARISAMREEGERLRLEYEAAARRAKEDEQRAVALAKQRADEAEALRRRLHALTEIKACRASWKWLMEVEDE